MLNLNELSIPNADGEDVGLWNHNAFVRGADVEVYFKDIDTELVSLILKHQYAVGCVAWLTDPIVMNALRKLRGVSIIVQKEDWLRPDAHRRGKVTMRGMRSHYGAMTGMSRLWFDRLRSMSFARDTEIEPVRCCGVYSDESRTLPRCHHKFLVLGEVAGDPDDPRFVPHVTWTGSYNFTQNATNSFENAVVIRSEEVAQAYLSEFEQVAALSEPLDWEHEHVCPEWRIGT